MELDFETFLDRTVNRECSDSEEDAFREKYIYSEKEEDFCYIKKAVERGYVAAYEYLAARYAKGNGCPEDWEKAFYYWNLSVQNQRFGYTMIGDCYRLGKGTIKNYDKAWEAYEKALLEEECRDSNDDGPSVQELLLISEGHSAIDAGRIEIDWLKYAVKKQTKPFPSSLYTIIARCYFKPTSDDFLSWIKLGAEAGNISAKCNLAERTEDAAEKKKLIAEIFNSEDFGNAYETVTELAKKIIVAKDYDYEKLAFRFLWETGEDGKWLFDYYQKQNREDDMECLLREIDGETDDFLPDHLREFENIPEGYFICPSCGHLRSLDESNPDRQGDICNECYDRMFESLYLLQGKDVD